MAPDFSSVYLWSVIAVLAFGTFGMRLSFIQVHSWIDEFPSRVEAVLSFIPPAILAALVLPELVAFDAGFPGVVVNARMVAGGVAVVVAWRTQNMLATIGAGMGVLWVLELGIG